MPDTNREEIAKLEALYANNPGGRVFTHLAEAYRKAGELDKARTILEQGISRHDDYASAHVVLGRVLQDQGDLHGAANAFRRVLQLDPDNRIALRTLGDLAKGQGQVGEALEHYRHLRTLDPGDEELEQVVGELTRQLDAVAPAAPAVLPAAEVEADPLPEAAIEDVPLAFESAVPDSQATEPTLAEFSLDNWNISAEEGEGLPGDLGALTDLGPSTPEVSEQSDAPEAPEASEDLSPLPEIDFGAEFVPEAGAPAPLVEDLTPADFSIDPAAAEPGEPAAAEAEPTFEALLSSNQAIPETAAEPTPEDLPTETLAELYRSQGFPERAAEVYRKLLQQRPGDEALAARLQELEVGPAPAEDSDVEQHAAWTAAPPHAAEGPSPWDLREDSADEDLAGTTVSEYLRGLLGWRPTRTVSLTGVQTGSVLEHDDADASELVLDQVETVGLLETEPPVQEAADPWAAPGAEAAGDPWEAPGAEGAFAEPQASTPTAAPAPIPASAPAPAAPAAYEPDPWESPAASAPAAPPAPAAAPTPVEVTGSTADEAFDSWFGADETPAAPAGAAPAAAAAESADEAAEGDDDLEMFRSWLQSLKK